MGCRGKDEEETSQRRETLNLNVNPGTWVLEPDGGLHLGNMRLDMVSLLGYTQTHMERILSTQMWVAYCGSLIDLTHVFDNRYVKNLFEQDGVPC